MDDLISRKAAIKAAEAIVGGSAGSKAWAILNMLRKLPSEGIAENADRCVSCGEIVPEGRQVCPNCENT